MSNKINIDDLLKQEMGSLSPEPPANLWQNISSQLPDVATASSATTAAAKTIAGVSIKTMVIAAATLAAGAVGYVIYISSNNTPSSNTEQSSTTIRETLPEAKNVEEIQTSDEKNAVNQTAALPKTSNSTSIPKSKKVQNKIIACGDFPDEEVPVDYAVPTSTQTNVVVNNEEAVPTNKVQQNATATTEKTKQETKESSTNNTSNQNITSEEFLRPNIPNVFTPNNDGYNDEFVITLENEVLYDLKITDAKGNVVFESREKNKHWNGINQRNGEACEPGVYVLAFRYQLKGMNEPKVEKGLILLKL
jgi:gliding motility-associated-like protein